MAKRKGDRAGKAGRTGNVPNPDTRSPSGAARPAAPLIPPGLLLVLLVVAGYLWLARHVRFTQDDAYISFRYAKHLIEGHGLVFNLGERVEGYTNFAWTMLMALVMKLGAAPVPASQAMGMTFGALAVFAAARFVRGLEGRWGAGAVAAAAFVAGNPAFALWSTGGLETAMFAFFVIAGLERGFAPDVGPRGRALAPFLFAAAALTRPEGPLIFVLWITVRAFDTWRHGPCAHPDGRRGLARDTVRFAAPLVPYAAWKLWYFGDLLPNPFYAKTGWSAEHLRLGMAYAGDFFRAFGFWGIPLVAGAAAMVKDRWRGIEVRLVAIWLVWAAYVVLIGGDVLYMHRFWLHALPLGAVLLGRGVTEMAAGVPGPRAPVAREVLGVALAAVLVMAGVRRNLPAAYDRRDNEAGFVANMQQTGDWLHDHLPPDATIAITTIGAISYYSDVRVIDMLGLTDYEVAHHPDMIAGLTDTWREVQYNAGSVLRRRPDMIFFSTSIRPSSAAEKALFFYPWFLDNYYGYYFRSKPWRENLQNGFRLRPDAPPFDPRRLPVDNPRWLDAYSDGHLAKSKERDNAKAVKFFEECARLAPPEFRWAREWLAVSRYDAADSSSVQDLRDIVAADPYATIARERLSDYCMSTRDIPGAEKLFKEILAVDPDDNLPWIGLAEVARIHHQLDEAFRLTTEAVKRWDVNPVHLVLHGTLATQAGDLRLAEASFRRALAAGADGETADRARKGLALLEQIRSGRVKVADVRAAMMGQDPAKDPSP